MKQLILGLVISFLSYSTLFSQTVSNVNYRQLDQQIEITYDLTGQKFYQHFNVAVYVSEDGGRTFTGPLKEVSGEVGDTIKQGYNKKILWNVFDEMPDISGQVLFQIRTVVLEKKPKKNDLFGIRFYEIGSLWVQIRPDRVGRCIYLGKDESELF